MLRALMAIKTSRFTGHRPLQIGLNAVLGVHESIRQVKRILDDLLGKGRDLPGRDPQQKLLLLNLFPPLHLHLVPIQQGKLPESMFLPCKLIEDLCHSAEWHAMPH